MQVAEGGGEVMNTRAVKIVILIRDKSLRPVCHNCKVFDNIPKVFTLWN